ncbi:NrfD/PsrC family molybdoenzyme membrane anchor subunit [Falsiroseomonas sp.]|uniref:NrfD/PsrC family molybdoenzyme membrane anchor subunit n=1 Tax=Falsiroseomonas sp. TaxID=2870721 RepID=UPI003563B299
MPRAAEEREVADTAPVARIPLQRFGATYWIALSASAAGVVLLGVTVATLLRFGTGVWGTNVPHVWGFDLINYVWWIGIANAASLLAVVLVLRRHGLRTAVNRFAEAAALAAVVAAGLYPILHLGRPWLFFWVFPYPATYQVWPQFRSTLIWDFWGITAHVLVTGLFWYIGLIPDLATMRDRAARQGRLVVARLYGVFALGWRGSVCHWSRHQAAYRLVAALLLPLLLAAQTVVALEFATTLVPDWHQARLPLHVVVTGLPSGLGLVLALAAMLRRTLGLHAFIDAGDMDLLSRLTAAASLASLWIYAEGLLFGLVLEDAVAREAMLVRVTGTYAAYYWAGLLLTAILPQLLWSRRIGLSTATAVPLGLCAAAGAWFDRYSIVVAGIERTNLPVARPLYVPSDAEWMLLLGTGGLFVLLLLLFARLVPVVSMYETRHEEAESEAA